MVEDKEFRKDLFYRLAVVKVAVPSLNKRPDDIIPIARNFLLEFGKKFNKGFEGISPDAEEALKAHQWKGNVRELKNIIERSALISEGPILDVSDIGLERPRHETGAPTNDICQLTISDSGIDLPAQIEAIEKRYFETALAKAQGNESQAARLLNLSRDTFRYRRKKLHLA